MPAISVAKNAPPTRVVENEQQQQQEQQSRSIFVLL
jgi:hypothetical protein